MVPFASPYVEYSGTVSFLHALRIDPFILGSRTIPPNAVLRREIRVSTMDPEMHLYETAAVGQELYIFFYPWNKRDFHYLDLVRLAMANPTGFVNFQGVTSLREDSEMMAYHVHRGNFERSNPDRDGMFNGVERNHVGESA